MKYPNLIAFSLSILLVTIGLTASIAYAKILEKKAASDIAHNISHLKFLGSAMSKAALQQPDLLPVFGASETYLSPSRFQSGTVFVHYPTGFKPFEVARGGASSLILAQVLAGLGKDVRGKKIVVSFSPAIFEEARVANTDYLRNFSLLHANQLIFSPNLHLSTKRNAAARIFRYKSSLRKDPFLAFALSKLAKNERANHLLYFLALPIGMIHTCVLEIQDHFLSLQALYPPRKVSKEERTNKHREQKIDWNDQLQQAKIESEAASTSNAYGLYDGVWNRHYAKNFVKSNPGRDDRDFIRQISNSLEWQDFAIMLKVLHDLGAQAILIGRPFKGQFYDDSGISSRARNEYYARIRGLANEYGIALADFHEFEYNKYFVSDQYSHTGGEGWVYVNRVMDDFFHGTFPKK